ncbi:hypothetical protein H8699_02060 [Christensenellaceae bacterium NSJ-44]|uniref:Uncharacterized protein n=1 Tax=Luoshenia tenuis TaxID=2763654 RepID=A0A926CZ27_9FIRM|nr:hypothetical protein [Luoshenia tenuis]MBC8528223.1 hypothetical protein [Luoshenia tenuis]
MANGADYLNRKITKKYTDVELAPTYNEWLKSAETKKWLEETEGSRISKQAKKSMNEIINRRLEAEKGVKEPDYEDESTQKLLYGDEDVGAEATKFIDGSNGLAGAVAAGAANVNAAAENIVGGGAIAPLPVFTKEEASRGASMSDQYTSSEDNAYKQHLALGGELPYNIAGSLIGAEMNPEAHAMDQKHAAEVNAKYDFKTRPLGEQMQEEAEKINQLYLENRKQGQSHEQALWNAYNTRYDEDKQYFVQNGIVKPLVGMGEHLLGGATTLATYATPALNAIAEVDTGEVDNPVQNIRDWGLSLDWAEQYGENLKEKYKPIEVLEKTSDVVGDVVSMAPVVAASYLPGGASAAAYGLSFADNFGSKAQAAYKETGDADQAVIYGVTSAAADLLVDKMFEGFGGAVSGRTGWAGKALDKTGLKNRLVSKLSKNPKVAQSIVSAFRFSEEPISEIIQNYTDAAAKWATGVTDDFESPTLEENLYSAALASLIQGGTNAINSRINKSRNAQAQNDNSLVKPAEQKMLSPQDSPLKSVVPLDENGNIQTVQQDIQTQQGPIVEPTAPYNEVQQSVAELSVFNKAVQKDGAAFLADLKDLTIKKPVGIDGIEGEVKGLNVRVNSGVDVDTVYNELFQKYPDLLGNDSIPFADSVDKLREISDIRNRVIETKKSNELQIEESVKESLKQLPIRNEDGSVNTANLLELRRNEWRIDTDLKWFNERSGITAAEKKVADLVASGDMDIRNIPKDMSAARIMEYATLKADADALHAPIREYNSEYQADLEARADAILEGMENWQDVRIPASNAISTPERVIRHTVKDQAEQSKVVDALIRTGGDADTRAVKIYNDIAEQVNPYKFTPEESKYIQMLGEGVITEAELPSNVSASRVKEGVQVFRGIYENLYQMVNEELVRTGQKPMGRIENYFPHISDPQDPMRRALKAMGFDVTPNALPTEINGRTEDFKPKHQWSRFMQRRTGNKTDYNALYGLDQYARSMANVVAYTDHIQLLRTVGNKVRFAHSDEGTQAKIREIMADQSLTVDEKQAAIDKFKANGDTHLSNLAAWLDEYANIIAGKKTRPDRVIESMIGRRAYSVANWLSNQLSRSAVVGNIGSAATNLISSTQAVVFTSKPAMLKANIDMAKNLKHNDGFVERSKFLQRRFGENKIYKTGIEKAMDKVDIMGLTDRYTAELIVRAKYNERLAKGDTPDAAMKYADGFAANLMGDRSRTQAPTAFGSKNPIYKALLQFQLEPFNQLGFAKSDLKRYAGSNGKAVGKLIEYALLMYLFDDAYEAIFGRRPALDPLGMANNVVGDATGKKLNNVFYMLGGEPVVRDVEQKGATETVQNAAMDVAEQIPVLGSALGGGRVPVLNTIGKVLDFELLGEIGQTLEGNIAPSKLLDDAGTWALETGAFLAPFGGGQAKKTIQGLQTVGAGGSYKRQNDGSEELQYEVDQNPWNWVKGVVGGKTAVGGGRYYEDGYPKAEPSTDEGIIEQHVRALPNIVTYKTGEGEDAEEHKVTLSDDMRALRQQFARNLIPDGVDLIELDEDVRKDMFKAIDDFTLDAVLERMGHPEYTTSKDTNTAIEALKTDVSLPVFYGIKQAFADKNEDGDSLTKQQKRNILMDWPDLSTEQKTRLDEIMLDVGTDVDYSSARTFELTNSELNDKQQKAYSQLRSQGIDMSEYEDILDTISTIKSSGDGSGSGNGGSAAVARYINNLPYDSTAKQTIADAAGINRDYSTQDSFVVSAMNESPQLKYKEAKKYIPDMTGDAWAKAWQAMTDAGSSKTKQRAALKRLGYTSQQANNIVDVRWMKLADLKD